MIEIENVFIAMRMMDIRKDVDENVGREVYEKEIVAFKQTIKETMEKMGTDNILSAVIPLLESTKELGDEGELDNDKEIYYMWFIAAAHDMVVEEGIESLGKALNGYG